LPTGASTWWWAPTSSTTARSCRPSTSC
jgi:hypothetical protein